MQDFQEFPKCLYLNGDILAGYVVVANAEEEALQADKGYVPFGEGAEDSADPAPRKRGRPSKAE